VVTVSTPEGDIVIPEGASERVKKAVEALNRQLAKDAEAKQADIWGGDENKKDAEETIALGVADILESHNIKPTLPSIWVQLKFTDGAVSGAELFTKYTHIRASTGPRQARASGGNGGGRMSIRDLVREKYASEPEKYTHGAQVFTSPRGVLDALAVPYYKASDPNPTGDAPQRVIVKFGRENPEAAAEIGIVLADGKTVTLADVVSK
jgi:hypothetical protein